MNNIYKIAVEECAKSYEKYESVDSTQWNISFPVINGKVVQMLSIPGTNEFSDMGNNLDLRSENGIKYGAFMAAYVIFANIKVYKGLDFYVTGHSLGGATAIALMKELGKLLNIKHCIVFAPARCLRYFRWFKNYTRKMPNTTMFYDPDDAVSCLLGFINFGLPICETIKAPKDHLLYSASDHVMNKWRKFVAERFE